MFKTGNGVDKIIPSLYIGNVNELRDQNQLELYTHIISMIDHNKKGNSGVRYFFISATDQPNQSLSQQFSQSNDFIHEARLNNGRVLIHYIGSRSIILAAAYLMSCTSLDAVSTFNALKGVRKERTTVINPNDGSLKQLQQFEGMRLKEERRRLFKKFNGEVFRPNDEVEARKLVKLAERNQVASNNFLSFTYMKPAAKKSNWDRSKNLMIKKSDKQDRTKDPLKDAIIKSKNFKQSSPVTTTSPTTKVTICSPTRTMRKPMIRSNSGLYLASNKPTSPLSPTGGVRRKLMHPTSILKKQMSIDSLNIQTANLNLNQKVKSPTSSDKQVSTSNLLRPFDTKKPRSAPAATGCSNPELSQL